MSRLSRELEELRGGGLLRQLRAMGVTAAGRFCVEGREVENFASNDYLGLSRDGELVEAFEEGVRLFGVGAASSRLVSGNFLPHVLLEEALAEAKGGEAALVFSSGFATALGCLPAICGGGDVLILDKLCHASLIDAAKLSGARLRIFAHNDVGRLREILRSEREKVVGGGRILVVTEAVFSMDGDVCPLVEIVEACEDWDALLWLDEAHSFGVFGETGMGLVEELGLKGRVAFQMGTMSKAAGLVGGYVVASRMWIDWFVNRARSLIYSTAGLPAQAYAGLKALEILRSGRGGALREKLRGNMGVFGADVVSPIVPVICGGNEEVLRCAGELLVDGFFVPAIRYPTVPRGAARLRVSLSAGHELEVVERLFERLGKVRG